MFARGLVILFLALFSPTIRSQNFSVSGKTNDAANGESIAGAVVHLKGTNKTATSNQYGFFSLSAPKGTYTLSFSYLGYKTVEQVINLDKNTVLNISFTSAE